MGDGFDQIGKKNMMRENHKKKREYEDKQKESKRRNYEEDDTEAKMDEYTHII